MNEPLVQSKVMGTSYLLDLLKNKLKEQDDIIAKAVLESALLVERDAKDNCPVDTGRLRSSITHEVTKIKGEPITAKVGSNVEYAPHVEFGYMRNAKPRGVGTIPFLYPALERNLTKIENIISNAIKQAIEAR